MKVVKINCDGENCYVCFNESNSYGFIVDPGCANEDDFQKIISVVKNNNITVKFIFLTHGHFDHILGVEQIKQYFDVPVAVHQSEIMLLGDAIQNLSREMFGKDITVNADLALNEGKLTIAKTMGNIMLIHTPGHTSGGICLYDEDGGNLISGDTLFYESYGRTDVYTSDNAAIFDSIKNKLFGLPGGTKVYPGHGPLTTIAYEIRNNPVNFE
ncbi:MAG: MBL fold metallo-hydrolase [Clostridiales bacterium]|jgi:glyoxylase-like metal-dependent hydrolase (beta-lactamase superfamily II)|nr:MBL fold metallo-hydrolase [Clostridiales bacterium]